MRYPTSQTPRRGSLKIRPLIPNQPLRGTLRRSWSLQTPFGQLAEGRYERARLQLRHFVLDATKQLVLSDVVVASLSSQTLVRIAHEQLEMSCAILPSTPEKSKSPS